VEAFPHSRAPAASATGAWVLATLALLRPAACVGVQELQMAGINFKAFDLGGHEIARRVWKDYYAKARARRRTIARRRARLPRRLRRPSSAAPPGTSTHGTSETWARVVGSGGRDCVPGGCGRPGALHRVEEGAGLAAERRRARHRALPHPGQQDRHPAGAPAAAGRGWKQAVRRQDEAGCPQAEQRVGHTR